MPDSDGNQFKKRGFESVPDFVASVSKAFAQRIEAYILELANVQFEAPQEAARLRIVK